MVSFAGASSNVSGLPLEIHTVPGPLQEIPYHEQDAHPPAAPAIRDAGTNRATSEE
jgi:hypothetical protein